MMDTWIIKIEGLFEYKPDPDFSTDENIESFLSDINYQGIGTEKKFDYKVLDNGMLEIGIELIVEWLSHAHDEDEVIAEFMNTFEYDGDAITLDYTVELKDGKSATTYMVEYHIYEKKTEESWSTEPMVCCIYGYESIEALKKETSDALCKTLTSHKTPDGEIMVEATIMLCGEFVDKDDFIIKFEGGKILSFEDV